MPPYRLRRTCPLVPSSPQRSSDPAILDTARAALALVGISGCGTGRYEPGIDPHTQGPLTVEEAELLVEDPFSELLDSLSQVAGGEPGTQLSSSGAAQEQGTCLWTSPMHAWTADMTIATWDELAERVRPAVKA